MHYDIPSRNSCGTITLQSSYIGSNTCELYRNETRQILCFYSGQNHLHWPRLSLIMSISIYFVPFLFVVFRSHVMLYHSRGCFSNNQLTSNVYVVILWHWYYSTITSRNMDGRDFTASCHAFHSFFVCVFWWQTRRMFSVYVAVSVIVVVFSDGVLRLCYVLIAVHMLCVCVRVCISFAFFFSGRKQ